MHVNDGRFCWITWNWPVFSVRSVFFLLQSMHQKSIGQYPSASKLSTAAFVLTNLGVVLTLLSWVLFTGLILGNTQRCRAIDYNYDTGYRKYYLTIGGGGAGGSKPTLLTIFWFQKNCLQVVTDDGRPTFCVKCHSNDFKLDSFIFLSLSCQLVKCHQCPKKKKCIFMLFLKKHTILLYLWWQHRSSPANEERGSHSTYTDNTRVHLPLLYSVVNSRDVHIIYPKILVLTLAIVYHMYISRGSFNPFSWLLWHMCSHVQTS